LAIQEFQQNERSAATGFITISQFWATLKQGDVSVTPKWGNFQWIRHSAVQKDFIGIEPYLSYNNQLYLPARQNK
jgi:hypothetical protein